MNCKHIELVETLQIFKNGTEHIRLECLDCGKFIKYKPRLFDDYKLWFGKHKGKTLKEIPKDYLLWYKRNGSDEKVIRRINLFLDK